MRWKWLVASGMLMIVILTAAVYVCLNTYDYNKLKPLVARVVEDATGRKLSLGGDVNFKFGFAPALVVTDVELANVSWGSQPQMVEIEKLQAEVRLLPLLFKDLDIKYIRLVGVKVLLEKGPDSQGNWDFPAGSNSAGSIEEFNPKALEVDQVSIENLLLTFRGNRTGSPAQFTLTILKRPKVTIRLQSAVIDFTALMKSLEQDEQKTANKTQQKRRLFSDDPLPFDVLKKVDADIVLKAKNIHTKDAHFKFGHMTLKLEDSDFSIDKLEATYKETKISGSLQINAGAPSQVAANFLIQNFNLGDFLKETGKSDQVRAIVDIAAHGKSKGDSVHSLMASLNGSIGAVMGQGYLTKYLDMLSRGLSAKVIPFWRPPKTVDHMKCAVVQFDIESGVAKSQAFVFDTRAGILSGSGDINLDTEQINFLLVPTPAHPDLSLAAKLRVSGTVMEPKVSPDTLSLLTKGVEALSTLAIGPLGLLAPFVHLGAHQAHPCNIQSIGQLGLQSPAEK